MRKGGSLPTGQTPWHTSEQAHSRVPEGGVTGTGWQEESHRVILIGTTTNPMREERDDQEEHGPFGTTTQARHGRRCGLSAGSPAGAGGRHHSLPRAPTRGRAEVSAQIGAEHGERNPERVTHRNGYRNRTWDTRVGTMDLRIPKLREGSYFPQPAGTPATQRESAAGGDPAGLRGRGVHSAGG